MAVVPCASRLGGQCARAAWAFSSAVRVPPSRVSANRSQPGKISQPERIVLAAGLFHISPPAGTVPAPRPVRALPGAVAQADSGQGGAIRQSILEILENRFLYLTVQVKQKRPQTRFPGIWCGVGTEQFLPALNPFLCFVFSKRQNSQATAAARAGFCVARGAGAMACSRSNASPALPWEVRASARR